MITGIILVVIGVIFYELYIADNKSITWWIWLLLSLGVAMTVTGAIVTLVFLRQPAQDKDGAD